jgi:hypothetical protein
MISDAEIDRVLTASAKFKPALLGAAYRANTDQIELRLSWCTLLIDRKQIAELRDVSPHDLETIAVSAIGLHIEKLDIDINAAGLLAALAAKLARQAQKSF